MVRCVNFWEFSSQLVTSNHSPPCPPPRNSFWKSQFRSTQLGLKILEQLSSLSQLLLSAAASYINPLILKSVPCKRKTLTFMYINILSKPLPAFSYPTSLLAHFQLHSSASVQHNVFREPELPDDHSQPAPVIELWISKICWRKCLLSDHWSHYLPLHPW